MDITIAIALDDVCAQIVNAFNDDRSVRSVHLDPQTYNLVAQAKAKQLSRGNPLLLLGHNVVKNNALVTGKATVI
jgi:hypothetical protein